MTTPDDKHNGQPLTLRLSEDRVPAQHFKAAVDAFIDLLNGVTAAFGAENNADVEWGISVREGSALIDARPVSANPAVLAPLTHTIASGLASLEKGGERPDYFNDKALGAVRSLAQLANEDLKVEVRAVGVETALSAAATVAVGHVLDAKYSDYGSLDGYMQVLSTRGKVRATLYDDLTDRPISCKFDDFSGDILDTLFRAMRNKRRVEVSGLISYRSDGQPISMVVDNFEVFPHSDALPDIKDIIGIFRMGT